LFSFSLLPGKSHSITTHFNMRASPAAQLMFVTWLAPRVVSAQSNCTGSLNSTTSLWLTGSCDTIFTIAAAVDRGVCDIARANRMADAELFVTGERLLIPAAVSEPDNSTCLLVATGNATADCIYGGPHTYLTVLNDTISKVALKFNVTADSLASSAMGISSNDAIIPTGSQFKLPQCSPSQCTVQAFQFTYGTYKDLAEEYNTTVGQLLAFNPGYNYSDVTVATEGPVITLPSNCVALSDNITVIS
jgi:hypothetical protein